MCLGGDRHPPLYLKEGGRREEGREQWREGRRGEGHVHERRAQGSAGRRIYNTGLWFRKAL